MERLTVRTPDGVQLQNDVPLETALERLAAWEDAEAALQQELDEINEKMELLRTQDKTRTATYRQLIADRFTLQELLHRLHNRVK